MRLRELKKEKAYVLKDLTYEAIYIPEGADPPERSIVDLPELRVYYEDFGSGEADHCIVCEDNGRIVGAVWTRIMDDYGHLEDGVPSFAIAMYKEYRGKGIGTELMLSMLDLLKDKGYEKASLSVQKENYAVRMYEKTGFRIIGENEEEYLMLWENNSN